MHYCATCMDTSWNMWWLYIHIITFYQERHKCKIPQRKDNLLYFATSFAYLTQMLSKFLHKNRNQVTLCFEFEDFFILWVQTIIILPDVSHLSQTKEGRMTVKAAASKRRETGTESTGKETGRETGETGMVAGTDLAVLSIARADTQTQQAEAVKRGMQRRGPGAAVTLQMTEPQPSPNMPCLLSSPVVNGVSDVSREDMCSVSLIMSLSPHVCFERGTFCYSNSASSWQWGLNLLKGSKLMW